MKFFLLTYLLVNSCFAESYVTNEQCQLGPIKTRFLVELERHLKKWPSPEIHAVNFTYAARIAGFPNSRELQNTMCCIDAQAEPEIDYPDCAVRRTICFDAKSFKLTGDMSNRSVNCDTGYP